MKPRFLLLLCLTLCMVTAQAQDRIVTVAFDTIVCKIVEVKEYTVVYMPNTNRRPEHMALSKVLNIERDVTDDIKRLKERNIDVKEFFRDNGKGWAFGFTGGYGHIAGRIEMPPGFDEYIRQLRNGFNFGADITYFVGKYFGAGIRYNLFHTAAAQSNVYGFNRLTGQPFIGTIADNVDVHTIGARFAGRFMTKDRVFYFLPNITLGYLRWDNSTRAGTEYNIIVEALSYSANFTFDFRIVRRLFFGIDFGYTTAGSRNVRLTDGQQVKVERLDKEDRFGLTRFDAGLSLRYYL